MGCHNKRNKNNREIAFFCAYLCGLSLKKKHHIFYSKMIYILFIYHKNRTIIQHCINIVSKPTLCHLCDNNKTNVHLLSVRGASGEVVVVQGGDSRARRADLTRSPFRVMLAGEKRLIGGPAVKAVH